MIFLTDQSDNNTALILPLNTFRFLLSQNQTGILQLSLGTILVPVFSPSFILPHRLFIQS